MSGIKGRSGKTTDPEVRRMRQLAGQMGGRAKADGRAPPGSEQPDDGARSAEPCPDDLLAMLPGKNPYDEVVLRSKGRFSYLDGKTREQVNGEVLSNEKFQVELAKARGDLLSVDQVEARDERRDEIFQRHLARVIDFVGTLVPPDQIAAVQSKAQHWLTETRAAIARELVDG